MRRVQKLLMMAEDNLSGSGSASNEGRKNVFMYITEGSRDLELMLTQEVGVMRQLLEEAGYAVDIATAGNQVMTSESTTLAPTIGLGDIDIDDYSGVILPCMAPPLFEAQIPVEVAELLEAAVARNMPIAASRGSVVPLAQAGGLAGREYAFASPVDTSKHPEFAGGTYLGTGVVRDGNISTSAICPLAARALGEADKTAELTRSLIASLAESF